MTGAEKRTIRERVVGATVTYGDRSDMCIRAVKGMLAEGAARVVIIDNGSAPASVQRLTAFRDSLPDRIVYRRFDRNEGSAPAFAAAFTEAGALDPEYLWLLDDDNLPTAGSLRSLLDALEAVRSEGRHLAAVTPLRGSTSTDPDGSIELATRRRTLYPPEQRSVCGVDVVLYARRLIRRLLPPTTDDTAVLEMPYAPWGGLVLPWDVVVVVGGPLAAFVLYGEDLEYTRRITSRGGVIRVVPEALVLDMDTKWIRPGRLIPGLLSATSRSALYYTVRNRVYREMRTSHRAVTLPRMLNSLFFGVLLIGGAVHHRRFSNLPLIARACADGARGRLERRVEF